MPRNLDMTALRSFVTVAESGGVTRASGQLNVTQSAVSMQLKRLEDVLGLSLLDRSGRGVVPTAAGEQLLSYARRMLELNDEALRRLTHDAYVGEIVLGVPEDIVYPVIPVVLQKFSTDFPRVRVQLVSGFTRRLKESFAKGDCDVILTTENGCDAGGETLTELGLVWVGAPDGHAWRQRPLGLAFCQQCIFRDPVQRRLDDEGIAWEHAVETDSDRTVEATVSADLGVTVRLAGTVGAHLAKVSHGGALPDLGTQKINLYGAASPKSAALQAIGDLLRSQISCL